MAGKVPPQFLKHKKGRQAAINRRLGKVIDPNGIPNDGDEYRIINGKKVPVKATAVPAKKSLPPWLAKK